MSSTGMTPTRIIYQSPKGPDGSAKSTDVHLTGSTFNEEFSKSLPIDILTLKLEIEQDTHSRLNQTQVDLHVKRLESLRNCIQEINDNDWQFPDPDKLLGLK